MSGPSEFSRRRDRIIALIAGVSVALLGNAILAGWVLDNEALKTIIPGADYPIKPNIAAGMFLCGAALSLLSRKTLTNPIRICAAAIATTVTILSALTVGEYFFGWDLGIEQWLIGDVPAALGISHPGRMSPITALSFVLVGVALFTASQLLQKRLQLPLVGGLGGALIAAGPVPLAGFFLEMLLGPGWNFMGMTASGVAISVAFFFLGSGLLALLRGNGHLTWSLDGLTTAGFASGLALMLLAAGLTYNFTVKVQQAAMQVSHAQELLRAVEEIEGIMSDIEREQRGYIITGNERLLEEWEVKNFAAREQVQKLLKLAANNSHQQPLLRQFATLVSQRISWANQTIKARRDRGFSVAQEMVASDSGVRLLNESRQLAEQIEAEEDARLHERQAQSELASRTAFLMLPLGVLLCFAILSLVLSFLNSGMGDRKQAEHSLRQSEEGMRAILDSALDCVITMDHQGRVMEFNPAAEKTFGYRRDETIGQLLSDLVIPPLLREQHQKGLSRYLATGEAPVLGKRLELSAVRRDGSEFPIELAITRIGSQVPPMFTGFIRDITERKQAEVALRQAEEKYRSIFENAAEGIFQTTPEGKYISVNPALARMYGYATAEELVAGVGDIGSLVYVNPDRRAEFKQLIAAEGSVERFEYEVYRKDRRRVWLSENARAVRDASGTVIYYEGAVQDITERKRAEAALKQAEEKYRNIVENAVEGVFQSTPDGRFITANLALARIIGFDSVKELIDERTDIAREHYVDPRTREEFKRLLEENGFVLNYELEAYRKDRSRVWLSENVRTVRDENGKVLYYEGTAEDVTKRKHAEDALRANEAHLQTVVENLNEGVVVSDLKGEMLQWNRAALKIHGVTNLEEGRRCLAELVDTFALSTMDDTPIPLEEWPLARILRGENLRDLELCVHNIKAGWYRTFNYGGTLVHDANNQPLMAVVTISDITERKKAEKTLREQAALFDQTYDAVLVWDWKGPITFWNRGAENLYGFTAVEAVDCTPQELLNTQIAGDEQAIRRSLDRDGVWEGEIEHTTSDGRQITVESRMVLVREPAREYVLETNRDITERKRAGQTAERLRRAEEEQRLAVESNRVKNEFLATMSHELRTPLNSIIGFSGTMLMGLPGPITGAQKKQLETIKSSARHQLSLINDLLDLAKIESGKVELKLEPIACEEIIQAVAETLRPAAESKGLALHIDLPAETRIVLAEKRALKQILINLLNNAIKFTDEGEVGIAVRDRDDKIEISVRDTGSGIKEEDRAKLFHAFSRLENGNVQREEGTGLGLHLSQKLAALLGGEITLESEPGKGSTFTFALAAEPALQEVS